MEIKIDLSGVSNCPYCLGSGKLKAMQSLYTLKEGSIRGKDTTVKCTHCNGTGLVNCFNCEGVKDDS